MTNDVPQIDEARLYTHPSISPYIPYGPIVEGVVPNVYGTGNIVWVRIPRDTFLKLYFSARRLRVRFSAGFFCLIPSVGGTLIPEHPISLPEFHLDTIIGCNIFRHEGQWNEELVTTAPSWVKGCPGAIWYPDGSTTVYSNHYRSITPSTETFFTQDIKMGGVFDDEGHWLPGYTKGGVRSIIQAGANISASIHFIGAIQEDTTPETVLVPFGIVGGIGIGIGRWGWSGTDYGPPAYEEFFLAEAGEVDPSYMNYGSNYLFAHGGGGIPIFIKEGKHDSDAEELELTTQFPLFYEEFVDLLDEERQTVRSGYAVANLTDPKITISIEEFESWDGRFNPETGEPV